MHIMLEVLHFSKLRLTANQQAALRCYDDVKSFITPPENQGQIVGVSYGCSTDYIYERRYDKSDRTFTITAYAHPRQECDFEPWNKAPALGRRVGVILQARVFHVVKDANE